MKNLKILKEQFSKLQLQSEDEVISFAAFDVERNRLFLASSSNFIYTLLLPVSSSKPLHFLNLIIARISHFILHVTLNTRYKLCELWSNWYALLSPDSTCEITLGKLLIWEELQVAMCNTVSIVFGCWVDIIEFSFED